MQKIITFNKVGYDPFLDFIKAYAILAVLLGHTFPFLDETGYFLWYGMQVPLFILVQVFHIFKKENYKLNRRNRQTLWGGRTDANPKTVAKRYMIAEKLVPLHYES